MLAELAKRWCNAVAHTATATQESESEGARLSRSIEVQSNALLAGQIEQHHIRTELHLNAEKLEARLQGGRP